MMGLAIFLRTLVENTHSRRQRPSQPAADQSADVCYNWLVLPAWFSHAECNEDLWELKMKQGLAIGFLGLFILSCAGMQPAGTGSGTLLPEEKVQLVRAACFEVVAEKSAQDSLTYAKPLNWELQSFAVRNDRYIPLGTAFAISATELVTAAHVMSPGSQIYKTRFIREKLKEGGKTVTHVYAVENVSAFSDNRDYVVFTVKGKTFNTWLKIDPGVDFNTQVFTAGDAYGEGIVVREGVLLDEVPEPENGAWNYLKSSIATNPGSSGGPLLNKSCDVIGIVLSRKDDFCYSLPMKEILPGKAAIHRKLTLRFPVFNMQKLMTLETAWDLPLPYGELADRYLAALDEFYRDGMDKLFAENKRDIFPEGPDSEQALFKYVDTGFPQIFLRNATNGSWFLTDLKVDTINIDNNGSVSSAEIYKDGRVWLLRLHRPRDTSVRELWDNPQKAMELVLKGINITRKLTESDQGTRVLSFGAPIQSLPLVDRFGRVWQINIYLVEYSDQFVMTSATPTPEGLSMIYAVIPSSNKDSALYDMREITDFMNISYNGTLEEWGTFLKQEDFRFGALKHVSVSYREGAFADIDTPSVSTRVREGMIGITKDSELFLGCSVFLKDGRPVWDIRKLVVDMGAASRNNFFTLYRWPKPTGSLPEQMKNEWKKKILGRGHPYTGKVYAENGRMNVGILHPAFVIDDKVTITKDFAYTLFASKEGTVSEEDMKNYIEDLARETRIKD
jgi:hypothetical protein